MELIDLRQGDEAELERLNRRPMPDANLIAKVSGILAEVRRNGDEALLAYTKEFDRTEMTADQMQVGSREFAQASAGTHSDTRAALEKALANVQSFTERSRRSDWLARNAEGAEVGERFDPFERIGVYVPAGSVPLVSSAVMTVGLARAIGVPEIVVTSPVGPSGVMNHDLLAALAACGATEIFKVGGVQAIAALAFGTGKIRPVAKIFGPGNAYVTEAKRQVFGYVAVDLLPGPSEILVLADESAEPAWVAADLLAQAEHGSTSRVGLVTMHEKFADRVSAEIESQLALLDRKAIVAEALGRHGLMILAADRAQAIRVANCFAPEHLSIVMADPEAVAREIRTAGAIFLGNFSPVAAGDFLAGPSHTLPTGGSAKSFSGLTADQFQRRTSLIKYDRDALAQAEPVLSHFSRIEQLDAHGRSVTIRLE